MGEMISRKATMETIERKGTMDSEFVPGGTWQSMAPDEGENETPAAFSLWNAMPRVSSTEASFGPDDLLQPFQREAEAPSVSWDHGFMQALGGLPFPLLKDDYDRMLKSLDDDTEVLESIASVDYSLLIALNRGSSEETGTIRMGLIDYLQPYNACKRRVSLQKNRRNQQSNCHQSLSVPEAI